MDRETLFKVLEEFRVYKKAIKTFKQTLTGTKSNVKFMGEISREFEIETDVRQGDGLSPILFNCVLEKILRTWKREFAGIENDIRIGAKKEEIVVDCLAFADDLAIITENDGIEQRYLEKLQRFQPKQNYEYALKKRNKYQNNGNKLKLGMVMLRE